MTMELLPRGRARLTRFPSQLEYASGQQGFGGTVVRNQSKAARQRPVDCHGIDLNTLSDKIGEHTCASRHVDADLAKKEADRIGSPRQKAHAG